MVSPFTIVVEDETPVSPGPMEERPDETEKRAQDQTAVPLDVPGPQGSLSAPEVTFVSSFAVAGHAPAAAPQPTPDAEPPETGQQAPEPPPTETPTPPEADRVDVLLKQFLQRYGRDSK